jgi:ribose-phosphate pyrophosphokinase
MIVKEPYFVTGNVSDSYFAIDLADYLNQQTSISDVVSLKKFANSEFCPRFSIDEENNIENTGHTLNGKTVIIASVQNDWYSRNELAMNNMILARAAKDNDADKVVLVEPDLFYSAQDRGPQENHGGNPKQRSIEDRHKFNGQPFTARMYAQLLKTAGVDTICTIHNHSQSTVNEFIDSFSAPNVVNLLPDALYFNYLHDSGIVNVDNLILVSPDRGAMSFIQSVSEQQSPAIPYLVIDKLRKSQREVEAKIAEDSPHKLEDIKGKDVVIMDDMVRTGSTVMETCKILREYRPNKVIFMVTHFYSSAEVKNVLASPVIDEIITTNTIPTILNRDHQGRLRKKMTVLKIAKWIAESLNEHLKLNVEVPTPPYEEDISAKNPRAKK